MDSLDIPLGGGSGTGLPSGLVEIALRAGSALRNRGPLGPVWLLTVAGTPTSVDPRRLAIVGVSRGREARAAHRHQLRPPRPCDGGARHQLRGAARTGPQRRGLDLPRKADPAGTDPGRTRPRRNACRRRRQERHRALKHLRPADRATPRRPPIAPSTSLDYPHAATTLAARSRTSHSQTPPITAGRRARPRFGRRAARWSPARKAPTTLRVRPARCRAEYGRKPPTIQPRGGAEDESLQDERE